MPTGKLVRVAQPGDVCIILVPTSDELEQLREPLLSLQAVYGGKIVETVHVTCQRFKPDNPAHLAHIIDKLVAYLSTVQPFTLIPDGIVTFRSEFWQSSVARWRVQNSPQWKSLTATIVSLLHELSCSPHYPLGRPPMCSALEQIPSQVVPQAEGKLILPRRLFEARTAIFSQIDGLGKFTLLKETSLGPH